MRRKIPYTSNERKIIGERTGAFGGPASPIYNTPVTSRENICALYFDKAPYWQASTMETQFVNPAIYNNNFGRGHDVVDAFGRLWTWVEQVGGSITHSGNPLFTDVNAWRDHITIPDIDRWDWAKAAAETPVDTRLSPLVSLINGFWFERMISIMDFMPAAMALVDPDQQTAIHDMFEAMTDLACKIIDKMCEYFPSIDGINVHDDWGSQHAPFFSEKVGYRLFMPYMKELTAHIHSKGRYASLHSCGHIESRIHMFIEAGFDEWIPQAMNDTARLYEDYGDQIIIAVVPPALPPGAGDMQYALCAREYVERFCQPGKPSLLNYYSTTSSNPVFREELYECSRKHYMKQ